MSENGKPETAGPIAETPEDWAAHRAIHDQPQTAARPWPDPPELEHMSGQFRLGYRQAQRDAASEIQRLRSALEALTERAFNRCLFPREVKAAFEALGPAAGRGE